MLIAGIGTIIGFLMGLALTLTYNATYTLYITLTILILLESLLRIIMDSKKELDVSKEILLVICEIIFACFLAFLGENLGISLYLVVMLVFGLRIFDSFNVIVKKIIKYDKIN
jgi:small basic protein